MSKRLELVWPHKGEHVLCNSETGKWEFCGNEPLPPRPLIEIEAFGDEKDKKYDPEISNLLIKGENLFALQSLLPYYAGKVKLIYIDPPFNTGQDFEAYDDNYEHSIWLSMIQERIELAKLLLADSDLNTGIFVIHLDDKEVFYAKVIIDRIFGRNNFITSITVKMADTSGVKMSHKEKMIPKIKHYLLIYAINKSRVKLKPQYEETSWEEALERYKSYIINIEENYENWEVIPLRKAHKKYGKEKDLEEFCILNAHRIFRTARNKTKSFLELPRDNIFRKVITATGLEKLAYKREEVIFAKDKLRDVDGDGKLIPSEILGDIWIDIGHNNLANEGGVNFQTKKPEKLLMRILDMFTHNNDIVLDFFAASGTTGAVAQKMKRKWIMIELGEQAENKALVRMKNVLDGDTTGISAKVNWQGGGGFRFLEIGDPFIIEDPETQITIINPKYTNGPLIRAVCAIEGFILTGDTTLHGRNGEHFAHITENFVDDSIIKKLLKRLKDNQSITVYAAKGLKRGLRLPLKVKVKRISSDLIKKYTKY